MEVPDLFLELASDTRCSILEQLLEKPIRSTEFAKKLNLSAQETHRNTARLTEAGLIIKDSEGFFRLTKVGKSLVNQFSYFKTLTKFRDFFENHDVDIPDKFFKRIGVLENCQLISKTTNVQENIKKIESNATEKIQLVFVQAWYDEGEIILNQMKNAVKFNTLYDDTIEFPDEILTSGTVKSIEKFYRQDDGAELRKYDGKLGFSMVIGSKKAGIMFPDLTGEFNFDSMFVGDDELFLEWCDDLFDYYWNKSSLASFKKLKK